MITIVGIGLGAVLAWQAIKGATAAVDAAGEAIKGGAINPGSANNLAYRGANAIGAAASGDESWSLGAKLFEWLNPGAVAAERAVTSSTPARAAGTTSSAASTAPASAMTGPTFGDLSGGNYYPWSYL